jgi:hypothetical protein
MIRIIFTADCIELQTEILSLSIRSCKLETRMTESACIIPRQILDRTALHITQPLNAIHFSAP